MARFSYTGAQGLQLYPACLTHEEDGLRVQPCLTPYPGKNVRKDFKWRPTGSIGSGPYFHAVKNSELELQQLYKYTGEGTKQYYSSFLHQTFDVWMGQLERWTGEVQASGNTWWSVEMRWQPGYSYGCIVYAQFYRYDYCDATFVKWGGGRKVFSHGYVHDWETALSYMNEGYLYVESMKSCPTSMVRWSTFEGIEVDFEPKGDIAYRKGEMEAFSWWDITGALPGTYKSLCTQAYIDACNNLPQSTVNTVANLLEAVTSLRDLMHGDISFIKPSNAKDVWLSYRYVYNTTKADIEEYAELTRRLAALCSTDTIASHGKAEHDGITCHVRISVDAKSFLPDGFVSWMEQYGFRLTATNVWDMIPYSFVADWFLHVGDFLARCEEAKWAYELSVSDVWTSFRTDYDNQSVYFRIPGAQRSYMAPFMDYSSKGPNGKTIAKRIIDSIALFG